METLSYDFEEAFESFVVFFILKDFLIYFWKSPMTIWLCNMSNFWPILANMLIPTVDIAPVHWDSRPILHNSLKLIITIITPICNSQSHYA